MRAEGSRRTENTNDFHQPGAACRSVPSEATPRLRVWVSGVRVDEKGGYRLAKLGAVRQRCSRHREVQHSRAARMTHAGTVVGVTLAIRVAAGREIEGVPGNGAQGR